MKLVLMQPYEPRYADLKMMKKQLTVFSEYLGFQFYIDRRSKTVQIYDNQICDDKFLYIQQNITMIINVSSCY